MKIKFTNYLISFLIVIIGLGGLLSYDFIIRPTILSRQVVMISNLKEILPKGHVLKNEDVISYSVDASAVPENYFQSPSDVIGKTLSTDVSSGVILVAPFVNDGILSLAKDEGIYPIPKSSIFAVNGSLRSGDAVDVYVVPSNDNKSSSSLIIQENKSTQKVLSGISVVYARSDDNNDVLDNEAGNINKRTTSTGNISNLELKMKETDASIISKYLDEGYKVWIIRVNQ